MMKLIIGNKAYSSWSLRPWVLMKHFQIPFEEVLIKLDLPETTSQIKQYSPAGKVPVLTHEGKSISESVAILEYLNDLFPEKNLYPKNILERARARSLVMEMHSGFHQMREILSFNIKKKHTSFDASGAQSDIQRMKALWTDQLNLSTGPFLFGEFGIVDAMFAPIAFRFETYNITVEGKAKIYCEALKNLPAMKEWEQAALNEKFDAQNHI